MKNFLGALVSAIAIVLLVPTGLILASWNAIPGDSLYGVKRSFEGVALAVTVNTPLASAFSLKFTDRRFTEANRLFAKNGSTLGYSYLVEGAQESKTLVIEKGDTKGATQLIANIETYQKGIEEKKLVLASQPASVVTPIVAPTTPTQTSGPVVTSAPLPAPTQPTQATQPPQPTQINQQQTIATLDQTNNELEKIKDELKKHEKEPQKEQNPQPGNENRGENDKGKNKD